MASSVCKSANERSLEWWRIEGTDISIFVQYIFVALSHLPVFPVYYIRRPVSHCFPIRNDPKPPPCSCRAIPNPQIERFRLYVWGKFSLKAKSRYFGLMYRARRQRGSGKTVINRCRASRFLLIEVSEAKSIPMSPT